MKKITSILLALVLLFSFAACSNSAKENDTTSPSAENQTANAQNETLQNGTSSDKKILIAYFSYGGTTEIFAKEIQKQIGGDLFKIEPVTPYPEGDAVFDYARNEQSNDERPEIKGKIDNIDEYDTVFIGYPIWWYDVPQIIKSFTDTYDLSGKTIIPFNTHRGSGDGGTYSYFKEQEPNAVVLDGLNINGDTMQNDHSKEISEWLSGLNY